jgi:hypothetical protein
MVNFMESNSKTTHTTPLFELFTDSFTLDVRY